MNPDRIRTSLYAAVHLRRDDMVNARNRHWTVTAVDVARELVRAVDAYFGEAEEEVTLAFAELGFETLLAPGPGRVAGLIADGGSVNPDPDHTPPRTSIALTCGGALHLTRVFELDGRGWGCDALALQADVWRWPGAPAGAFTSGLEREPLDDVLDRVVAAGRLDGDLSYAGKVFCHDLRARRATYAWADMWTRACQAHLGLNPHIRRPTPAHTLVTELAPIWSAPIAQLGDVLDALHLTAGAHLPG